MNKNASRLTAVLLLAALIAACLSLSACRREIPDKSGRDTTTAEQTGIPENTKELITWLKRAYRSAERVYSYFTGYGKIERGGETLEIDGAEYEKISEPGLGSRAELESLCEQYFGDKLTSDLMETKVGGAPLFADRGGALYRHGGYAEPVTYEIASDFSIELINSNESGASFTIKASAEIFGARVTVSQDYFADFTDGRPVFSEFVLLAEKMTETLSEETEGGRFEIGAREGYSGITLFDTKAFAGAFWTPLSTYGEEADAYTFAATAGEPDPNKYIVNFWPAVDGTRYVTLGYVPYKNAGNTFAEYRTFKIVSRSGEIISITKTPTPMKSAIRDNGTPYTGSLDGTYTCKSYSNAAAELFVRTITISGGNMNVLVGLDASDLSALYSGSFSYEPENGAFNAELEQLVIYEDEHGVTRETKSGRVYGRLLAYGGAVHFLCTYSDFSDLSPSDPVPLSFIPPDIDTSYMPDGAGELLFSHRIFASDTYLLSYRSKSKNINLYYTKAGSQIYTKLDIALPPGMDYDTAEAVFASDGGGSGEACFYVELTSGDETAYLRYDNFAYTDGSDWLSFKTDALPALPDELIFAYGYDGAPVKFPNSSMPGSADAIDELDLLGLPASDIRLLYIKAFLEGDTKTLEELCVTMQPGIYDIYRTIEIDRFVAFTEENPPDIDSLRFCFSVKKSELDAFLPGVWYSFIVSDGISGVSLLNLDSGPAMPASEPESQLRLLLGTTYITALPTSDTMTREERWSVTEYLCIRLGVDVYHSAEKVAAAALDIFGIPDFTADESHVKAEGVIALPHGGVSRFYDILRLESAGDAAEFNVQYYADPSKTIKSHLYKYSMKQTDSGWVFTGSAVLSHEKYEPWMIAV